MFDRRLIERIDACRPGSDDARDSGLAPLAEELAESHAARASYECVQKLDQAIGDTIQDVEVPEGLSERLLARLAAQQTFPAIEQGAPPAGAVVPAIEHASRRRWLSWSIGVAAAASISGVVAFFAWSNQKLTEHQIREDIVAYHMQDEPQTAYALDWLAGGYPLSRYVHRLPGTMWRPVEGFLHRNLNGVAYEMIQRGTTATLYVVPIEVASLPSEPPQRISTATGGWITAAWQEGGFVYVLVVRGDGKAYRTFIRVAQAV